MSKGSGSTRATNSRTAHGSGKNSGGDNAYNTADMLRGVPQSMHSQMLAAADKVSKMSVSEKAAIKPSLGTAMEYTAALKMNPERNQLASIFESKGSLIHGDGNRTGLVNGVYDINGVKYHLNGNEVNIGVKVSGGDYKRVRGRAVLQPTKVSKGLSTINVYDTEKMKKLISILK